MTAVEIPHEEYGAIQPVDHAPTPVPVHGEVRITGRVPIHTEPADFGSVRSFVLVGTEDKVRILPYDKHRTRAKIYVTGAAASTTTTTVPTSNHPSNPAAGADFTVTVPAGQTWTLQAITMQLVTSATVANRTVQIIIDDGTNTIWEWVSAVAQTAGQTELYSGGVSGVDPGAVRGTEFLFNIPTLTLTAGWRIRSSTAGIQVGDQYSAIDVEYLNTTSSSATVTQVYLGSEAQCAQVRVVLPNGPANTLMCGVFVSSTTPIPWESKSELWMIPDQTHAATVTVIEERNQA